MAPVHDVHKMADADGHFRRKDSQFRNSVQKGGKHPPERGRYLLYVGYFCPWASRTLIARQLKGLEDVIDVAIVYYRLNNDGWEFKPDYPGCTPDPLFGASTLKGVYVKADPEYDGRFTVPVLWDKKENTIVNNESSEIIRIFNTEFDDLIDEKYKGVTYYPDNLRTEIDEVNDWVYHKINNGVYKSGFATTQQAYEDNVVPLFDALDRVEEILKNKTFLIGPGEGQLTEADLRLFTTLIRFDVAYHGNFKCNLKMIRHDYPGIHRWLRNLYWNYPAFRDTTKFDHIKNGYYGFPKTNPSGIVPLGPLPDILPLDSK